MVLVFMDESYLHTHHAKGYGWYLVQFEDDDEEPSEGAPAAGAKKTRRKVKAKNNKIVRGTRGKRLVIVHAITKDGWLRDSDLPFQTETDFKSKVEVCDCEMLFDADYDDGDYHKHWRFRHWV